jgi:hypothetical protein
MPFVDFIYKMFIYRIKLKYYIIFIIFLYEFKVKLAFIIINSYYYYLIYYFSFNYINNFYKNKEYFVYNFSL